MKMSQEKFCRLCEEIFWGTLVKFRIDSCFGSNHWAIKKACQVGCSCEQSDSFITWRDLKKHVVGDRASSWPVKSAPKDPNVKLLLHHTFEELLASAAGGCPSCNLFVREYEALRSKEDETSDVKSNRPSLKLEGDDRAKYQGVPVLCCRNNPSDWNPQLLQLGLWFLQGDRMIFCDWPPDSRISLHIDVYGPKLALDTERIGHFQAPTLAKLRTWLETCRDTGRCQAALSGVFEGHPRRLIQINASDEPSEKRILLRDFQTTREDADFPQYVTLSHCWGHGRLPDKLTSCNIDKYRSGIGLSGLPKSFSDAVEVTLALGQQHIWIDALCIIQDSEEDWNHEAPRMGSVYAKAAFNIAATGSKHSDEGLFMPPYPRIHIGWQEPGISDGWYCLRPGSKANKHAWGRHTLPQHRPLDHRAWALQERLLSGRVIDFERDEIRWTCSCLTATDLDVDYWTGPIKRNTKALAEKEWGDLVKDYLKRDLTYESDRLVAFSAIAEGFARMKGLESSSYLAGIWRHDIHRQLLWYIRRLTIKSGYSPMNKAAVPSWSWASVAYFDADYFEEFSGRRWDMEERLADRWGPDYVKGEWKDDKWIGGPHAHEDFMFLKYSVQLASTSPFSSSKDAQLQARGLILTMTIRKDPKWDLSDLGQIGDQQDLSVSYYKDSPDEIEEYPRILLCMPLVMSVQGCGIQIEGLVLARVTDKDCTFKRTGLIQFERLEKVPSWWRRTNSSEIDEDTGNIIEAQEIILV